MMYLVFGGASDRASRVSAPAVVCHEQWADVRPECSPLEVKTA